MFFWKVLELFYFYYELIAVHVLLSILPFNFPIFCIQYDFNFLYFCLLWIIAIC